VGLPVNFKPNVNQSVSVGFFNVLPEYLPFYSIFGQKERIRFYTRKDLILFRYTSTGITAMLKNQGGFIDPQMN